MLVYKTNKGYKFNSFDKAEVKNRTKKQKQTWFNLLTKDEQEQYIQYRTAKRQNKRREDGYIEPFRNGTDKRNCRLCIHGRTNSCQDKKDKDYICRSYYNMNDFRGTKPLTSKK